MQSSGRARVLRGMPRGMLVSVSVSVSVFVFVFVSVSERFADQSVQLMILSGRDVAIFNELLMTGT